MKLYMYSFLGVISLLALFFLLDSEHFNETTTGDHQQMERIDISQHTNEVKEKKSSGEDVKAPTLLSVEDDNRNYINSVFKKGIIPGYPEGEIYPSAEITRAQWAVILGKAFDLKSIDLTNSESLNSKLWMYNHFDKIAKATLTQYKNFDVTSDYISRAEISAMLASVFKSTFEQRKTLLYRKVLVSPFIEVKSGISEQNQIIGTIPNGKVIEILGQINSQWSLVAYKDIWGYVLNEDLTEYLPLAGKVIILDPGHGGRDPGALGNDLVEKHINLEVSLKVRDLLENKGAIVYMTRKSDKTVELSKRFVFSQRYDADIFVSIHTNAHYDNFEGIEAYYNQIPYEEDGYSNPFPEKSYELTKLIHFSLLERIPTKDNGIYDDDFRVLRKNTVPSALIELGYLSNTIDANKIKSETFRLDSASGIVKGIERYFLSHLE